MNEKEAKPKPIVETEAIVVPVPVAIEKTPADEEPYVDSEEEKADKEKADKEAASAKDDKPKKRKIKTRDLQAEEEKREAERLRAEAEHKAHLELMKKLKDPKPEWVKRARKFYSEDIVKESGCNIDLDHVCIYGDESGAWV